MTAPYYQDSPRLVSLETGDPIAVHVTITRRDTGELVFEGDLAGMPMPLEPDMPTGVEGAEA